MGNLLEVTLNILSWRDLLPLLQVLSVLLIHLCVCCALANTNYHVFLDHALLSTNENTSTKTLNLLALLILRWLCLRSTAFWYIFQLTASSPCHIILVRGAN